MPMGHHYDFEFLLGPGLEPWSPVQNACLILTTPRHKRFIVVVCFVFLPFIYFTSLREQDKADINSLQWSAPVGLEPAYIHMWVACGSTVLQTPKIVAFNKFLWIHYRCDMLYQSKIQGNRKNQLGEVINREKWSSEKILWCICLFFVTGARVGFVSTPENPNAPGQPQGGAMQQVKELS